MSISGLHVHELFCRISGRKFWSTVDLYYNIHLQLLPPYFLPYFLLSGWTLHNLLHLSLVFKQKVAPSSQQNATRCGLWWVEMLKARYQYKEAATVYFRVCNEVMLIFQYSKLLRLVFLLLTNSFSGAATFRCNAWASILLLLVVQTTYVTQIWISSCSFWWPLQEMWSGSYISKLCKT